MTRDERGFGEVSSILSKYMNHPEKLQEFFDVLYHADTVVQELGSLLDEMGAKLETILERHVILIGTNKLLQNILDDLKKLEN
ncbi:hypothetical protein [Effusibacillus consociatus]|uniref:Uncharacterized protein n=1 Tax=Effusibacillus consociatus TaxID=1117041 RepID=A0ABV9Q1T0_9BACL